MEWPGRNVFTVKLRLEVAAQIRREWLTRQLMGEEEEAAYCAADKLRIMLQLLHFSRSFARLSLWTLDGLRANKRTNAGPLKLFLS